MAAAEEPLSDYRKRYSLKASPADFLSGDLDKRSVELVLHGKKSDDLNGAVKRRLLSDLNRHFWLNPRDADDTRLVFEATERSADYTEGRDGSSKLVLKIEIGLAHFRPEEYCC